MALYVASVFRYPQTIREAIAPPFREEVRMPAYVVVDIDVHDHSGYEQYKKAVNPSIEAYGGRYLVRGGHVETLEGNWTPRPRRRQRIRSSLTW
jgi:Domain of unknown function (DUF1330)